MEMKAFVLVRLGFEFKKHKLWQSTLANIHRKDWATWTQGEFQGLAATSEMSFSVKVSVGEIAVS